MSAKEHDFTSLFRSVGAKPCDCRICKYSRHIRDVKARGDIKEMRQLIEELSENLWNAGEALSMAEAEAEDLRKEQKPA